MASRQMARLRQTMQAMQVDEANTDNNSNSDASAGEDEDAVPFNPFALLGEQVDSFDVVLHLPTPK